MTRPNEVPHGWMYGRLFRIARDGCRFQQWDGEDRFTYTPAPRGTLVKCVMVSRLGDCGVTPDLTAEFGYALRLFPDDLELADGVDVEGRDG